MYCFISDATQFYLLSSLNLERDSGLQDPEAIWIQIRLSCLRPAAKLITTICTFILPMELLGHGHLAMKILE